jgi:hypothetical protein
MPLMMFLALIGVARAQELDREAEYRQNAAVLARYPDVPMALDAPALKPGRTDFTSQAEMEAYLAALKARVAGARLARPLGAGARYSVSDIHQGGADGRGRDRCARPPDPVVHRLATRQRASRRRGDARACREPRGRRA